VRAVSMLVGSAAGGAIAKAPRAHNMYMWMTLVTQVRPAGGGGGAGGGGRVVANMRPEQLRPRAFRCIVRTEQSQPVC
jgi:hypothetical protein